MRDVGAAAGVLDDVVQFTLPLSSAKQLVTLEQAGQLTSQPYDFAFLERLLGPDVPAEDSGQRTSQDESNGGQIIIRDPAAELEQVGRHARLGLEHGVDVTKVLELT